MEQLDYARGASPLYLQIKAYIRKSIIEGIHPYGTLIHTEPVYEKMFGVSRITVRQAINELQAEGFVKRIRGRGTEVIYTDKIEESLTRIQSFTAEMNALGLKPGTKSVTVIEQKPTAKVKEILQLDDDANILKLERIRTVDGKPIVVFETCIEALPCLPRNSIAYSKSLYEVIEQTTRRQVKRVKESFEALVASESLAQKLDMKKGEPILLRTRVSFDATNKPIEFTISFYKGTGYKYAIEISE
ncbi:MAG: GntR family transcriptional regulator [Culicoidibacterales bacterium]